jgi:Flp pilus assembly pilin Flp
MTKEKRGLTVKKILSREVFSRESFSNLGTRWYCKCLSESGQGVAEYIIILAVIVIACIILAVAFHEQLSSVWESVTSQLGGII